MHTCKQGPPDVIMNYCKDCGDNRVLRDYGRCMNCQVHFEIFHGCEKGRGGLLPRQNAYT